MTKIFVLLAILLILSGALVLAVPRADVGASRGLAPESIPTPTLINQARDIAEQVNAPLSILMGLVSLYYSRRTYVVNRDRVARDRDQRA